MAIAANWRYDNAVRTPGGKLDTNHLDGNDGSAAIPLAWTQAPDIRGKESGSGYSINIRTSYLTEPTPGAATIVSTTLPTGWSFNGTTLSLGAGVGIGSVTFTATYLTFSLPMTIVVESVASGSADTTAPTKVLAVTVTPTATGLRITHDPAMDGRVTGQNESGMDEYEYFDGVASIGTQAAESLGLSAQLTGVEIGGSSGGSIVQTGNNYQLTSNGTGIGTTDAGYAAYQVVTGDFVAGVEVHGFTGGNASALAAMMLRETLDAGSRMSITRISAAGARTRIRATASTASTAFGAAPTDVAPGFIRYQRTGGVLTSFHSVNGNAFSTIYPDSTSWANQLYLCLFGGTGGSGGPIVVDFRNFYCQQQAQVSFDYPITDGAAHSITVVAKDGAANAGLASTAVTATAPSGVDITPPTVPGVSVPSGPAQDTVSWTWPASTDASGIRGYVPSISTTQNGTYTDQPEQTGTTFNITGLAPSTGRWMKVKAIDNANNQSAFNAAVLATSAAAPPADSTPPTVPGTGGSNGATGISTTQVRISSTGSTDSGSGVAHYRVYVAASASGPFNQASDIITAFPYNLTAQGPGIQSFLKLTAVDAAGNESAQSGTFSGTTLGSNPGPNLVVNVDFSDGVAVPAGFQSATSAGSGDTRSVVTVSDLAGATKAIKQTVVRAVTQDYRCELSGFQQFPHFQSCWYGFAVKIDPATDYTNLSILFQSHHSGTPDSVIGTPADNPVPFMLGINSLQFALWHGWMEDLYLGYPTVNPPTRTQFPNKSFSTFYAGSSLGSAFHSLTKGVWYEFVFEIVWDPRHSLGGSCLGKIRLWKNDVLVYTYTGAVGYGPVRNAQGSSTVDSSINVQNTTNYRIGPYMFNGDPFGGAFGTTVSVIQTKLKAAYGPIGSNFYSDVSP